jgi:hypothetical protein
MTPSGTRGVLNDALSIHLADEALANAFVARRCIGAGVEATGGVFQEGGRAKATVGGNHAPDALISLTSNLRVWGARRSGQQPGDIRPNRERIPYGTSCLADLLS